MHFYDSRSWFIFLFWSDSGIELNIISYIHNYFHSIFAIQQHVNEVILETGQSFVIPLLYFGILNKIFIMFQLLYQTIFFFSAFFCNTIEFIYTAALHRPPNSVCDITSFFFFAIMMSIYVGVILLHILPKLSHTPTFLLYVAHVIVFVIHVLMGLLIELEFLIHSIYKVNYNNLHVSL